MFYIFIFYFSCCCQSSQGWLLQAQSAPSCPSPNPTIRQSTRICFKPFFMFLHGQGKVAGGWIFPGKEGNPKHPVVTPQTPPQSRTQSPNHPSPSTAAAAPSAQILQASQKSITHFPHPTPKTSLIQPPDIPTSNLHKIPSPNLQKFPHPTSKKFPHPTSKNSLIQPPPGGAGAQGQRSPGAVRGRKMQITVIICCRALLMMKFGRR